MLHILFTSGSFGSTVYGIIRAFDSSYNNIKVDITSAMLSDSSMHGLLKTGHYCSKTDLELFFSGKIGQDLLITTPTYPVIELKPKEIIDLFIENRPNDKYIFIFVDDIDFAEIILMARDHKVAAGIKNTSISTFFESNSDHCDNLKNWNINYKTWSDMEPWELREWYSMYYPELSQEIIEAVNYVPDNWLRISVKEILDNPRKTFRKIIDYSGHFDKTFESEFNSFVDNWRLKQQYIIDEHKLINRIVYSVINDKKFHWKDLNFIAESIIQKRLRSQGYNIKCYELNQFPTSAEELHTLLEKVQ